MTQNFGTELVSDWQSTLSDYITVLVASPDGRYWAVSSASGEVALFDRAGTKVGLLAPDDRTILTLAWSSCSRWLCAGGESRGVIIWDTHSEGYSQREPGRNPIFDGWVERIIQHPYLPYFAASSGDRVEIFEAVRGENIASVTFSRSSIFDLSWEPNGDRLAVAGYKGIDIWSSRDWGNAPILFPVNTATIKLAWSSDGRYLAAGNLDRSLTIWDLTDPTDPWILQGGSGKIRQILWSTLPDSGEPLLIVATGTQIVLWGLHQDELVEGWQGEVLSGHEAAISAVAIHPEKTSIASAALDGYICWWNLSGEVLQILDSSDTFPGFTTLAWNQDGSCLASGDTDGHLVLWRRSC